MKKDEEYKKTIELLRELREESYDDPKALEEYNKILESQKFQELEDQLINICNK